MYFTGHLASADFAESGNYFNNAAVAACAAKAAGAQNIMIVDWDVHHGKGTEQIFYDDASVLVVSLHKLSRYVDASHCSPSMGCFAIFMFDMQKLRLTNSRPVHNDSLLACFPADVLACYCVERHG